MQFDADLVVAAWGQPSHLRGAWYERRVREVVEVLGADRMTCLGTTTYGHPFHPQVWSKSWNIRDWSIDEVRRWDR
jgi:hypothetical protein